LLSFDAPSRCTTGRLGCRESRGHHAPARICAAHSAPSGRVAAPALLGRPSLPLPDCKKRLADVLEDLGDDHEAWWPRERLEHLLGQMKPDHHAGIERMRSGKTVQYATVYRRMRNGRSMAEVRTDGISGCLRTPRGGSSRQILVKAGRRKVQARYMTPREYARLQGVDGNYRISGTLNRGLFGFGDAVCVPVIRWIVRNYLDVLARRVVARSHEAGGVLTGINGGKTHPRPAPQGRSTPVPPRT